MTRETIKHSRHHSSHRAELLASRATVMQQQLTESEARLWSRLRGRRLGVAFRRQVVIGNAIVDFCAPAARLVVEVDGGYHATARGGGCAAGSGACTGGVSGGAAGSGPRDARSRCCGGSGAGGAACRVEAVSISTARHCRCARPPESLGAADRITRVMRSARWAALYGSRALRASHRVADDIARAVTTVRVDGASDTVLITSPSFAVRRWAAGAALADTGPPTPALRGSAAGSHALPAASRRQCPSNCAPSNDGSVLVLFDNQIVHLLEQALISMNLKDQLVLFGAYKHSDAASRSRSKCQARVVRGAHRVDVPQMR